MKAKAQNFSLFASLFLLIISSSSCSKNKEEKNYDQETKQKEVLSKEAIDDVVSSFETIKFNELSKSYKNYTDPDKKFRSQLKNKTYRIVKGKDIFKFVVGKFRLKDFLASDKYSDANERHLSENWEQYWLVDKEMLYMILEFILQLDELGYDKYGFRVRESHRHPLCNKVRGGASKSQHINGKAVDMVIEDINQDGRITQKDKEICLEILEPMIGSRGGIGRYPGTMTIHIDSRGHRARWDSY
jgi:Peptidase M15